MEMHLQRLCKLSTDLETIFAASPGCEDSDVRDRICAVLQSILVEGDLGAPIPRFFGIFNPMTNLKIRATLKQFVKDPEVERFVRSVPQEDRIAELTSALANDRIVSDSGTPMTEILGEWV